MLVIHVHEKSSSDSSSVKSCGSGGCALRSCFRISSSETWGELPSTHSANLHHRGGVSFEIMSAALTDGVAFSWMGPPNSCYPSLVSTEI